MLFLATETSSSRGSLALFLDRRCLREVPFPEGLVHGREIAAKLRQLLDAEGLGPRALGGVAVSIGPGLYTGCRVGVTAAKTLAFALGIPLVALSSLDVLAATAFDAASRGSAGPESTTQGGARPMKLAPILDGRRGFFYGALFRPATISDSAAGEPIVTSVREAPDQVGRVEQLKGLLDPGTWISGDGADGLLEVLGDDPLQKELVRAPADWDLPTARALGELAWREFDNPLDEEAMHRLEPSYLRPSEPEILLAERQKSPTFPGSDGTVELKSPSATSGGKC